MLVDLPGTLHAIKHTIEGSGTGNSESHSARLAQLLTARFLSFHDNCSGDNPGLGSQHMLN